MSKIVTDCLLISDFTVNTLGGHLENAGGSPDCRVEVAPFDQVAQVVLQADHDCWSRKPQFVVLWTRPERVSPSFGRVLAGEAVPEQQILDEVGAFCELVSVLQERVSGCLIPSWVLTLPRRGLGLIDLKADNGIAYLLARMNLQLIQRFSSSRCFYVLDAS